MAMISTLKKHAELVDRMAGVRGLDLEELVLRGEVEPDALGDAVLRCTGCSNPEGCSAWMNAQVGVVPEGPSICRNGELFDSLLSGNRA